ncbi:Uncharacterised protein [Corynebacterium kutscheri]|uniref:hypothetical protein n=1 Tax=Corynebacterium kutscheri TaxID=35755 RepID=UPI000F6C075B|nr:hypothetical protein [Corynebacterium kutscheri]VEH79399.1 Uncharacterised protein [Corynebacterium kutscheri]
MSRRTRRPPQRRPRTSTPDGRPYIPRTVTTTNTSQKSRPQQPSTLPLPQRLRRAWKISVPFRILVSVLIIILLITLSFIFVISRETESSNALPDTEQSGLITEGINIENSPAVEMYIPRLNLRAHFETESCRVKDGAIDPDTLTKACTYTAADKPYVLPGTHAEDIVVIAGHTGSGISAVFNKLYNGSADTHTVHVNDRLYLRTEKSGQQWLVYAATDLHSPDREGLSSDDSVWGTDPTPGRLLTISCIQPANPLAEAVRNAVVGWQYQGVLNNSAAPIV